MIDARKFSLSESIKSNFNRNFNIAFSETFVYQKENIEKNLEMLCFPKTFPSKLP